ncbi:hypothetical protein [uncultured Chryseobacterium sp.]|uniref:hypothetical protein n=1 Tax=uncultured Chryseobacterium sp. TaxID=259322 RepID=UPI0037495FC8
MSNNNQNFRTRKISTAKQSGGGGFVFEEKVSAWLCAHLLSNRSPFSSDIGNITRIDYQVRSDGWLFDDLLLTTTANDDQTKVAISSKSNIQIGPNGAFKELLGDLWNQYNNTAGDTFNKDRDYLCIINSRISLEVSKNFNLLLRLSKENDPVSLLERLEKNDGAFSQNLVMIFKGFHCPEPIASTYNISKVDTIKLLSRIIFLEFDFENDISFDENQIIELCKICLTDQGNGEAELLYKNLCLFRSDLAPVSGYLDYNKLTTRLMVDFKLEGVKDHISDWARIKDITTSKLNMISDKIGNKLVFSNTKEINELDKLLTNNKSVFILGKSGYGKSVLVKNYVNEKLKLNKNVIWLDSLSIQTKNLESLYGLENSLSDMIDKVQTDSYLVIDGIDRFFKDVEFDILLPYLTEVQNNSCWKVILTCQSEDYESVLEKLYRKNMQMDAIELRINIDLNNHLLKLYEAFPELAELFKHQHLVLVLNNLKYLDLLAYHSSKKLGFLQEKYIGESTIVDWIWKEEIDITGSMGSRFVQSFADKQAQNLTAGVPISDFSIPELIPLNQLKKNKVFYEFEDRLFLTHDLFGDWARYKLIRANKGQIKSFLLEKDLFSPLWCKAIRLYGIYLLENFSDASEWITLFEAMNDSSANGKIIQDLLLESIIFSANTLVYLNSLFNYFVKNDGLILKRFLQLFLHKATLPNKIVLDAAQKLENVSMAEASSIYRIPNHVYWFDVLNFIDSNKAMIIELSNDETIRIVKLWLEYTSNTSDYRKECSMIALEIANSIFESKRSYLNRNIEKEAYKAFLLAVDEFPDEVVELSLKLSKRIKVEKKKINDLENEVDLPVRKSLFEGSIIREPKQWEDGPCERVNETFRNICINDSEFFPLILRNPEKAMEILLALFISEPKSVAFGYDSNYNLDINEVSKWFPPFYTRGPFLNFLQYRHETGLKLIITLVNFATDKWSKIFQFKNLEIPVITINLENGSKNYIGDYDVYFWFRDNTGVPHVVVSALMALEKFLYSQIDDGKDISNIVHTILHTGKSVAFLGLLNAVGKYSPSLFLNVLKPMLGVFKFYEWEKSLDTGVSNIEGFQMNGATFLGEEGWNLAKSWNEMPHRKKSLQSITILLALQNNDLKDHYSAVVNDWKKILIGNHNSEYSEVFLDRLISFYTFDNYKMSEIDGENYIAFFEPEELSKKYKADKKEVEEIHNAFIFPFSCYRQIEEKKQYSLQQSLTLFEETKNFVEIDSIDPYHHISGQHQCVLAGCELLLANKDNWIKEHPEIFAWIMNYTEEVVNNYNCDLDGLHQHQMEYTWSQFASRIIASRWLEDPSNFKIRKIVARLLVTFPYDSVGTFFTRVASVLKWNDSHFIQLQNLMMTWSASLYKVKRTTNDRSDLKKLQKISGKLINDFALGNISSSLLNWCDLRMVEKKKKSKFWDLTPDAEISHFPGIDVGLLKHIFRIMPPIDTVDHLERQHILLVWKQFTEQLIFELGEVNELSQQNTMYPEKMHLWILEGLAKIIAKIGTTDDNDPSYFWKSILRYGYLAGSYVDSFCTSYFLNNINNEQFHKQFLNEWKRMLEFAKETDTWRYMRIFQKDSIWESLMGMSALVIRLWGKDDHTVFFKQIVVENINIIKSKYYDNNIISCLLKILKTEAGMVVLKNGIETLNLHLNYIEQSNKTDPEKDYIVITFQYEDLLAQTVSFLWERHKNIIIVNPDILNGFKSLVLYLVAIQNPIGLELQSRILE